MLPVNEIYFGDCLDWFPLIDDNSIDLTVTSPPYDNLRTYKNECNFKFEPIAKELYRVTKIGGVVVWVVGDATIKGSETGTSFKQALYFKEIGFNLHDTMIYRKGGQGGVGGNIRYLQDFEYMFIFSKQLPKSINLIYDRLNKVKPRIKLESSGHRNIYGEKGKKRIIERKKYGRRFNIWKYHESGTRTEHPAIFPEQLAYDHILSWSNENDLILDPMCGSGTTCKMAKKANRNYIGIEMVEEYYNIATERLKQ